jgi:drug/metabolite transporter (DMT)-like permease
LKTTKLLGLVLLVLGVLALAYGGFTYTEETHDAKLGPIELEIKDKERVNVPVWVGAAAALAGGVLLARRS